MLPEDTVGKGKSTESVKTAFQLNVCILADCNLSMIFCPFSKVPDTALIVNVPAVCVFVCIAKSVVSAFIVIDVASVIVTTLVCIADIIPAVVTTTTFDVPPTPIVMFPSEAAILTLLVPLLILDPPPPPDCATHERLPEPSVLNTYAFVPPVILTLPTAPKLTLLAPVKSAVPVLVKPVNVPTLVIFGCAFVYTVPDTKLLAT